MNDLHNHGRYTWKSGYYEGGWKNSTRHGKGERRCLTYSLVFCVSDVDLLRHDPLDQWQQI